MEGILLYLRPVPRLPLIGQLMEGLFHMGEVQDEVSVEVNEANKRSNLSHIFGGWPFLNPCDFDQIHFYLSLR